ncbi:MAG: DUF362 domain-containing protein [Methanoregulaceae archaeon]|nr:MAG: DUF362 domain-containing protein [Methanoregulaceae archaeon]
MRDQADVFITGKKDRKAGVQSVLGAFDLSVFSGLSVAVKANFNSADPFPASTHIDTLDALCGAILEQHPTRVTLVERSGMGNTRGVLENAGVLELARDRGFVVTVLDELDRRGWQEIQAAGLHWSRGFFLAKDIARADYVVQTCCLKTHRYGGDFTLSLKNMVGTIARRLPGLDYDFMNELHTSPRQKSMIAEISKFCRTDIIVMDATLGFSSGGPDKGKLIEPGVILASRDRVAIDAAGVALLRASGTVPAVMKGMIFEQEQIARAVELGVGIGSADRIRLVPLDEPGRGVAEQVQHQLDRDGQ